MILNNYWNFIVGATNQPYYETEVSYSVTNSFGCKNLNNQDLQVCIGGYGLKTGEEYLYMTQIREHELLDAIIGTGTTPPVKGNYALDTDITSTISNYETSVNMSSDANGLHTVITISGQNNTGDSITISEIGVIKKVRSQLYHRTDDPIPEPDEKCLFVRHVLDNPKTVPNGEGFNLTFEWTEA